MLNWMSIGAEYVECPLYSVYEKGATVCGHVPARQVAVTAPPMQHDAAGSTAASTTVALARATRTRTVPKCWGLHGGRQGERAYEQWVGQREHGRDGRELHDGGGQESWSEAGRWLLQCMSWLRQQQQERKYDCYRCLRWA